MTPIRIKAFLPQSRRLAGTGLGLIRALIGTGCLFTGCLFETRTQAPTVVFLGNSITKAETNPLVGWTHTSGMAASSLERDYVHATLRVLAANGHAMNAFLSHRDCGIGACDGPLEEHLANIDEVNALQPRYAVVQLGENSDEVEAASGKLRAQYHALLLGLEKSGARRIFCITPWGDTSFTASRTKAVILAMQGIPDAELVDITKLSADPANAGDPALYSDIAVLWHPGDKGMDGIAKALAEAILARE